MIYGFQLCKSILVAELMAELTTTHQASSSQVLLVNVDLFIEDLPEEADEDDSDEFVESSEFGDSEYSSDLK